MNSSTRLVRSIRTAIGAVGNTIGHALNDLAIEFSTEHCVLGESQLRAQRILEQQLDTYFKDLKKYNSSQYDVASAKIEKDLERLIFSRRRHNTGHGISSEIIPYIELASVGIPDEPDSADHLEEIKQRIQDVEEFLASERVYPGLKEILLKSLSLAQEAIREFDYLGAARFDDSLDTLVGRFFREYLKTPEEFKTQFKQEAEKSGFFKMLEKMELTRSFVTGTASALITTAAFMGIGYQPDADFEKKLTPKIESVVESVVESPGD